ncbi:glycosyltransferase [Bremerella sp. T1]|uniref:glycosyltransferase n=1 Tax=Bremerella sp. TYQ1 TaxID=3119568 RepID=UPI001CCCC851|nr:glycosyltransferase [Bremerella volcania]UBM35422.1 glycosyltransferase [Bremerella volcania]
MKVELLEHNGITVRTHFFPCEFKPENGKVPKLAIVSAYDCLCGIAEYTYFLVQSLKKFADVTVIELDQDTFKYPQNMAREDAEKQLSVICDQLGKFDAVNLQFEPGTLGHSAKAAYKRLTKIVDASPSISVTFHTFLNDVKESRGFWKEFRKLRFITAFFGRSKSRSRYYLTSKPIQYLKQAGESKNVTFIVHTKREVERLVRIYRVPRENAFDHPLAFMNPELTNNLKPSKMKASLNLPSDSVVMGIFGFISPYKGTDLAVEVMRLLPKNYHLLIAGGLHPNEAKAHTTDVHPYLNSILRNILGKGQPPEKSKKRPTDAPEPKIDSEKLIDRVHFLGAQDRDEFLSLMNDCDVVLLPYREVGQTSSGPISMAVEMKKRVIASRTEAFAEFAKYYPNRLEQFDQNNFVELSQRVRAPQQLEETEQQISWLTNVKTYFDAHQFAPVTEAQRDKCLESMAPIHIHEDRQAA